MQYPATATAKATFVSRRFTVICIKTLLFFKIQRLAGQP
ncbi:hypothetical protein FORC93_4693 [Salmonella enterica subsp. enterica serovar Braenderup]|nr:hypothetical protein FORC93_4693 [Salmonella enterica subsp. enterica serovar Braenderup]